MVLDGEVVDVATCVVLGLDVGGVILVVGDDVFDPLQAARLAPAVSMRESRPIVHRHFVICLRVSTWLDSLRRLLCRRLGASSGL